MTTEELIIQAQNGDRPSLTRLLLEHRGLVLSVTGRLIGNSEQRKDVIQDVFVKAITRIRSFAGLCKFSTWLYRITLNECIEHGRRTLRSREKIEPLHEDSGAALALNTPDGFSYASSAELRSSVAEILKTLPLDQKTAFSLFYFGGYTGKEGAESLSITEANFFMKLKAARDTVKQGLIDRGWSV